VATSRVAQVSYQGYTDAPTLVSALGRSLLNRITLTFSESINATDGRAGTNYAVTSSRGSNLVVIGGIVQGGTVTLATDPRVAGENYFVTVNNVRDMAGNAIAPNSTISVATERTLITGTDSVWHYFQSDHAPNPGWNVPGYEDFSDWDSGPALFDAKNPAGRTAVGPNNEPVRTMLNLLNPPVNEQRAESPYILRSKRGLYFALMRNVPAKFSIKDELYWFEPDAQGIGL